MEVKVKDIVTWIAIVITFLIALGSATPSEVENLEQKIDSLRKVVKKNTEAGQELSKVVGENVKLIDEVYKCNPYC